MAITKCLLCGQEVRWPDETACVIKPVRSGWFAAFFELFGKRVKDPSKCSRFKALTRDSTGRLSRTVYTLDMDSDLIDHAVQEPVPEELLALHVPASAVKTLH